MCDTRRSYPYLALTVWSSDGFGTPEWRGDLARWTKYFERGAGYVQGDAAVRHVDGAYTFHGRSDEVMNVGGNRIGTEEIESAILLDRAHEDSTLLNCAVVGMPHTTLGSIPCAFLVLQPGAKLTPAIEGRIRSTVQARVSSVAVPSRFIVVPALPETYSGKYMRRILQKVVSAEPLGDLGALRNPECIDALLRSVKPTPRTQPTIEQPLPSAMSVNVPTIAQLTADILEIVQGLTGRADVSARAPLMDVGVDSLGATHLASKLEEQTGAQLSPTVVFEYSTAEAIAAHLQATLRGSAVNAMPAEGPATNGSRHGASVPIHVTGMSSILPAGSADLTAVLHVSLSGVDTISTVPSHRWVLSQADNSTHGRQVALRSGHGGFSCGVELFDGAFFSVSPAEATATDPQQRLLLEKGYHAFHGSDGGTLGERLIGVSIGIELQDFLTITAQAPPNEYLATGSSLSIASGRLSFVLGLHGPCAAYVTACSSSLVAWHSARRWVQFDGCSGAIAAGMNLLLIPRVSLALGLAGMTSETGRCHTFDERANGYVRSEACAAAVIMQNAAGGEWLTCGSSVRSDGRSASLTAPNGQAQQRLLVAALAEANTSSDALSLHEVHGTGTALGDTIEMGSLAAAVLAARKAPLTVAGVKASIGHAEPVAGMTGLLKLALGLHCGESAPNVQLRALNSLVSSSLRSVRCTLPVHIGTLPAGTRIGCVSSFGYNGTIANALLHDASAEPLPRPLLAYRRRAFPWSKIAGSMATASGFTARRTDMRAVATVEAAATDRVVGPLSADEPLMEAGFTSLMATRLAADLQARLRTPVSPVVLFQYPTPRDLQSHLREVADGLPGEFDGVSPFVEFLKSFRAAMGMRLESTAVAIDDGIDDSTPLEVLMDSDVEELDIGTMPSASELAAEPRTMLLTGCTGWLGTFLLAELLLQTSATVYCLVRAESSLAGKRRIEDAAAQFGLRSLPLHRCVVMVGSLEREQLGLSAIDYNFLANAVDAIWHNGARVDHLLGYRQLRASNVIGTVEVLRLAMHGKVKPVHFVSTYATIFSSPALGRRVLTEDVPLPSSAAIARGDLYANGYSQSKCVAERLLLRASRAGLPVTIHRPARVLGSHRTGACNSDDLITRLITGIIQLKSMPLLQSGGAEYGAPVDTVAAAIVALGLDAHRSSSSFGQTYHVFDPKPTSYVALFLALGVEYLPRQTETKKWLQEVRESPQNVARPLLHELEAMASPDLSVPICGNPQTVSALAKLGRQLGPSLDYAQVSRQLAFLRQRRMLPPSHLEAPVTGQRYYSAGHTVLYRHPSQPPSDWLFRWLSRQSEGTTMDKRALDDTLSALGIDAWSTRLRLYWLGRDATKVTPARRSSALRQVANALVQKLIEIRASSESAAEEVPAARPPASGTTRRSIAKSGALRAARRLTLGAVSSREARSRSHDEKRSRAGEASATPVEVDMEPMA